MKTLAMITAALCLSATAAHADLDDVSSCGWATDEIESGAEYVTDHWNSFENFVEDEADVNIGNCLENRFKSNGKVVCEDTGRCRDSKRNNGWASYLAKKIHICDLFLDGIRSFSDDNQIACAIALMTHEFGHTCWRGHGTVEDMDNAAFDWFKGRSDTNVTITLAHCGMD